MSRVGLLMKKLGCSFFFQEGRRVPITLLLLEENFVVSIRHIDENCAMVGVMFGRKKHPNKPQRVSMSNLGIEHVGAVKEFKVSGALPLLKSSFDVSHFTEGLLVDASGISIGKGFAGPMKRHNFAGLRASHGVSLAHRSGGSTGQRQDIGRTYKGRKMAGQMGNAKVTVQNLKVVYLDVVRNIVGVKGSVPGSRNSYVVLRDAIKV